MMIFSDVKHVTATLTIYCILLTSLSQSIYGAEIKTPQGRRHETEVRNIMCRLWQNCISYQDDRVGSHQWECSFDDPGLVNFDEYSNKKIVVDDDENLNEYLELRGAVSGASVLVLSHADISNDSIIISTSNIVELNKYNPGGDIEARRLTSQTGTLNTLVVRVNALDSAPSPATDLYSDIFDDEYCLKSQYDNCSYGKLQIQEYTPGTVSDVPTIANAPGVVDINVDASIVDSTKDNFQNLANQALQTMFNTNDPGSIFDLVLFCMPPGVEDNGWLAYAYINRWDSYYNGEWCQAVSSQMHEVGHNIGLEHSGEYVGSNSVQEYGDQTDMMGFSYANDDAPAMCFNPAKSWNLGWYADKQIELDARTDISTEPTSFILNGVVDYQDDSSNRYIVVKINDFYIGFNRAASFNSGVQEAPNEVTIIKKLGDPETPSLSKKEGSLNIGESYKINLTDSVGVNVKYVSNSNGKDAVIEINFDSALPECEGGYDEEIQLVLTTDNYPSETSWKILNNVGQPIYSVETFGLTSIGTYTSGVSGLCRGLEYYFVIDDSYGDGICCDEGSGSYSATFEGEGLFSGDGQFGQREMKPFSLPLEPTTDCMDNQNKEFEIDLGNNKVKSNGDCNWLASKKKAKRKEYCTKKVLLNNGNQKKLSAICKETCGRVGKGSCKALKNN